MIIEVIQRLSPPATPVVTLTRAEIIVARYLLKILFFLLRFLIPGTSARLRTEEVRRDWASTLDRSKSRWSRHIGQCYSSVSFLHFFLRTLLPLSLSLLLFLSIFHFFLSETLNTILFAEHKSSTECANYFYDNERHETRVGLVRSPQCS